MRANEPASPGRRRWRRWVVGLAVVLGGTWLLFSETHRDEEKELRTRVREAVRETFPEESSAFSRSFGLVRFEAAAGREGVTSRGCVVLVHGLDDPGKVWRNLAPALAREGFDVRLLEYPNDQPITESAAFFLGELEELEGECASRVSIVGHSMGGLVAREMLTSPHLGWATLARQGEVPDVSTFIMVGTPNHGSPLARLRVVAEVRDHLARVTKGEGSWLGGILDGAGEAKIDLLPDSRFLTELNRRPQPTGVEMLTIAGVASPWSEDDIHRWIHDRRRQATAEESRRLEGLEADLVSLTRGLGDGLVSVESTRLHGVEHLTVEGTHLTMIRNLMKGSDRIPPSVPVILERLDGAVAGAS